MNKLFLLSALAILLVFGTSCEAVGDIFQAGIWVGVVIVVIIVAIVIYVFNKLSGKNK
jgi:di/tricarboxylate transporter